MSGPLKTLIFLGLAACGSSSQTTPVATLLVTPSGADLIVGQTMQLTAVAQDEAGQAVESEITWASGLPAVVSVTPDGVVTGVAVGLASVIARAGGKSAMTVVKINPGQLVGPGGARVTNGRASLDVPAGAVADSVPVGLDVQPAGFPLDPMVVEGAIARVTGGQIFAAPATLEITYTAGQEPIGLAPPSLVISRYDGATWHDVAGSAGAPGKVSAPITEGGTYAARMATPTAPCTGREHRQFDFWLGVWNIHSPAGGGGHSEITRDDQGCLLFEHFTEQNVVGRSVNFYNPADLQWHETYIDSLGSRILLSGSLMNSEMVLTGPPGPNISRITWSKTGQTVRQFGEGSSDGGTTWVTQFEGFYEPVR